MRKILYFLFIFCLILCTNCRNKKQVLDKPDNLISRNTIVKIIADSYLIESTIHLSPDSIDRSEKTQLYYKELFNRYKVTREQFIQSIDYYVSEESSAEKLLSEASALIAQKCKEQHVDIPEKELENATDPIVPSSTQQIANQ